MPPRTCVAGIVVAGAELLAWSVEGAVREGGGGGDDMLSLVSVAQGLGIGGAGGSLDTRGEKIVFMTWEAVPDGSWRLVEAFLSYGGGGGVENVGRTTEKLLQHGAFCVHCCGVESSIRGGRRGL